MITRGSAIPFDGYWKVAGQVFCYPLATVFAASRAEADRIAGPEICVETYDMAAVVHLALDSAEAQLRLDSSQVLAYARSISRGAVRR